MDIYLVAIYRALFGLEYVALVSTVEFEFRLRFMRDRCNMRDTEYRR